MRSVLQTLRYKARQGDRQARSYIGQTIQATGDGDWEDPSIWDAGKVPGRHDDVVIEGYSVTTNQYAQCHNLTVGDSAQTAISVLTLNNSLEINGDTIVFEGSATDLTTVNPKSNTIVVSASSWTFGNGTNVAHYFNWGDGTAEVYYWMSAVQPSVIFRNTCAFTYHKVSEADDAAAGILYFCKSFTLYPNVVLTIDMDAGSASPGGYNDYSLYWQLPGGTFKMMENSTIQNGTTFSRCGMLTVWDGTNTHDVGTGTQFDVPIYFGINCYDGGAVNKTQEFDWSGCVCEPRTVDVQQTYRFSVHFRDAADAAPGDTATFKLTGDWIIHPQQEFYFYTNSFQNPAAHGDTYAVIDPNGYLLEYGNHTDLTSMQLGMHPPTEWEHGRFDFSGNGGTIRLLGRTAGANQYEFVINAQQVDATPTPAKDLRIDLGTAGVLDLLDSDFRDNQADAGGDKYASAGGYIYFRQTAGLAASREIHTQNANDSKLPELRFGALGGILTYIVGATKYQGDWTLDAGAIVGLHFLTSHFFDNGVRIHGATAGADGRLQTTGGPPLAWTMDGWSNLLYDRGTGIDLANCTFVVHDANLDAWNADDEGGNSDATIDGRSGHFGD